MSRYHPDHSLEPILNAVSLWKERAFGPKKSLFSDTCQCWTISAFNELVTHFVENPLDSDKSFWEKLEAQLIPVSKEARLLMSELLWLLFLFPAQKNRKAATKREQITKVFEFAEVGGSIPQELITDDVLWGVGSCGQAFQTGLWREVNYTIQLFKALLEKPESYRTNLLSDPWSWGEWQVGMAESDNRQFRHMISFLLFPDEYESYASLESKRKILSAFKSMSDSEVKSMKLVALDQHLYELRQDLEQEYGTQELVFYREPLASRWQDEVDDVPVDKINYWIFQGNPKIYDVKSAIKAGYLKSWSVKAHKEKITNGDKFILWVTGDNAGCYALGTVISEVEKRSDDAVELIYYTQQSTNEPQERVAIRIDYEFINSPILKDALEEIPVFENFKGGNQGTNFKSSKMEYDAILKLSNQPRIWAYSPGEQAKYWDEFYNQGIMAIGWDALGDLSNYSDKESIVAKLQELENTKSSKKNDATALYQFCNEMKPGDIILAKRGRSEFVGYGIVSGEYRYQNDRVYFKNVRSVEWKKKGSWLNDENVTVKTLTDLTSYSDFARKIIDLIMNELATPGVTQMQQIISAQNIILFGPPGTGKTYELLNKWMPKYRSVTRSAQERHADALREFVSTATWWEVILFVMVDIGGNSIQVSQIHEHPVLQMKASLSSNKNVKATLWGNLQMHARIDSKTVNYTQRQSPAIFDKNEEATWVVLNNWRDIVPDSAERIDEIKSSESALDEVIQRSKFITFHQSYGYEEFIEGLRPITNADGQISYDVTPGVFQQICNQAKLDPDNRYAIFIDEINRGNISKIFGELITLIETDKRVQYDRSGKAIPGGTGIEITLPYSGKSFGVPANLDIIGTMNTADRSIALLDVALRRRFDFKELMPDETAISGSDGTGTIENGTVDLRKLLCKLNKRIRLLAGRELQLGHAFFCSVKTLADLQLCFANKIVPLLQEYFYGHWERIQLVLGDRPDQLTAEERADRKSYCFVLNETLDEIDILGYDHDDHDNREDFYVNDQLLLGTLKPMAFTKIYRTKQ